MSKLPRVTVHEVPPGTRVSLNGKELDLVTPFVPYRSSPLPDGVTPIYSVKLGGPAPGKRVRVRG